MSTRCQSCKTIEDLQTLDIDQLVQEQQSLETDLGSEELRTQRLSMCAECS
jgi:hypothetical protein